MNREDLENYRDAEQWVENILEEYEDKLEKIKKLSQVIDDMPKARNKPNYEHEKIMDEYKEILEIAYQKQKQLKNIIKQLDKLKPLYSNILFLTYVEGMKLEEVAEKVNYSYNKTCTYKGLALNEFDKLNKVGNFG